MRLSGEKGEMFKQQLRRKVWEEQMVEVVSEFITFRLVSIEESESLGLGAEEMEELFDGVCSKLKEVMYMLVEEGDPLTMQNLERVRKNIMLENVEVNVVMI